LPEESMLDVISLDLIIRDITIIPGVIIKKISVP